MNRKSAKERNYYGQLPTGYYNAVYKDRQFIDTSTKKEITLQDGAEVRIQVLLKNVISDDDFEEHTHHKSKQLDVSVNGHFTIGFYQFIVELKEPLILTKQGRRHSKLARCE